MAHVRKQIRAAVVTALKSNTDAGLRVYPTRVYPLDTLPAIGVYTLEEESETKNWEVLRREVRIAVEAYAKTDLDDDFDDYLDDLAEDIETVMAVDRTFGGLAKTSYLIATEIEKAVGDVAHGLIRLIYKCEYRTAF